MTWPTTTSGDVLSGKGVENFGQDLYDRDEEIAGGGFGWNCNELALTASFATVGGTHMRVVPWALNTNGTVMKVSFHYKRAGGDTGNQEYRIRETVSATTGGTTTVTPTTSWQSGECTLTVPDDTWPETFKDFVFEGRMAAGATGSTHKGGMFGTANCAFVNT